MLYPEAPIPVLLSSVIKQAMTSDTVELPALAMLGVDAELPALAALQGMISPTHLRRAVELGGHSAPTNKSKSHTGTNDERQQLQSSQQEDTALVPAESATTSTKSSPSRARVSAAPTKPANLIDLGLGDIFWDASGAPIREEELRKLFGAFDPTTDEVSGKSFISRSDFMRDYRDMENFGVEWTERGLEQLFGKLAPTSAETGRLSFEEFSLLMLHRSKM